MYLLSFFGGFKLLVLVLTIILLCSNPTEQQFTTQPVNIGWIIALPWDVSNTLRAPLGGPVALVLAAIVACALFLGLALSPVTYIFGYPQRIYHPARKPGLISHIYDRRSFDAGDSFPELLTLASVNRSIEMYDSFDNPSPFLNIEDGESKKKYPDFIESAFLLIPEEDTGCRQLIVCHAHGFLQIFPTKFSKVLRFFSKRMLSLPEEYKSAVLLGLTEQASCVKEFKCSKDISIVVKEMLYNLVPHKIKDLWKLTKLFNEHTQM